MRGRDAAVVVALVALVLLFLGLLGGGVMMGPWMHGRFGYGFGIWGGIATLLFWLVVVVGGILLVSAILRQGRLAEAGVGPDHALNLLRERYARGEITRDQYEGMRRDLLEGR